MLDLLSFLTEKPKSVIDGAIRAAGIRTICVECGPDLRGIDPADVTALGRSLARAGIGLVYCGDLADPLQILADAILGEGGAVTGLLPIAKAELRSPLRFGHRLMILADAESCLRELAAVADAVVVLPGGVETLKRLLDHVAPVAEGRRRPTLIIDLWGVWQPMLQLLDRMTLAAFMHDISCRVVGSIREVVPTLLSEGRRPRTASDAAARATIPWLPSSDQPSDAGFARYEVPAHGAARRPGR